MLQRGTTLEHNKYYIEDVIGRGGFGHVYRARERLTGEVVAIKELTTGLENREMVQRFVQEARATLRLTHPYIARTYGIFQDRGTYYLTMEYLPGGSLADRLRHGPLPVRDAARIATNVCKALAYAHDKGVVHCDIKPANVLFDKDGEVRLADFGIAHVSEQMMTRKLFTATGMMMGTVRYMAPEQLEGVRDDPRVDIYAMGAMLYEMLAGRPYLDFESETTPAAQIRNFQRIQSESPRSLRAVNPATPAWLAEAVARALRKRPEDRFDTVASLGRALQKPPPPRRVAEASAPVAMDKQLGGRVPIWIVGGVVLLLFTVALLSQGFGSRAGPEPTIELTSTSTSTPRLLATSTPRPEPSPTWPPDVPPPNAALHDTWTRPADEMVMVYVPGGTFQMGSTDEQIAYAVDLCVESGRDRDDCEGYYTNEQPVHEVTLDGFWIDQTEVTNAQYGRCVAAGDCEASRYADDNDYNGANYPVVGVSWHDATAYCEWAGGRLPTEAEWEYAARGEQGHVYPWGDEDPTCDLAQFSDCSGKTVPVGSFPEGASWCGALDMAGNVWEWVGDWYDVDYYARSPIENPTGPESGEFRVLRGGSWVSFNWSVRSAFRFWFRPTYTLSDFGFRCVAVTPQGL